jgi:hypothetical protein
MHDTGDDESLDTLYRAMEMSETAAQQRQRLAMTPKQVSAPALMQTTSGRPTPSSHATPLGADEALAAAAAGSTTTPTVPPSNNNNYQPPGNGNNTNVPSPPTQQQPQRPEEYDRWFLWELLEFAQKRSWKKKLLTYVPFVLPAWEDVTPASLCCLALTLFLFWWTTLCTAS